MSRDKDPIERLFERSGINGGVNDNDFNPIKFITFFFVFFFLIVGFGNTLLTTYTDWLWFTHDARFPIVFTKKLASQWGIWIGVLAFSYLILMWNINQSLKAILLYFQTPMTFGEKIVFNIVNFLKLKGKQLGSIISIVLSYMLANYYSTTYQTMWWAQSAVPFNVKDPLFGLDLSYYVFYLPAAENVLGYLISLTVLCLVIVALGYFMIFQLSSMLGLHVGVPFSRVHVHVLAGIGIILLGCTFGLNVFDDMSLAGLTQSFTGPGHAAFSKMEIQLITSCAFMLVGLAIILNGWVGRAYRSIAIGLPTVLVSWFIIGSGYPVFVQRFIVDPNRIEVEKPYAKHAINMTRYAYGLDNIKVKDFNIKPSPSRDQLLESTATMQNMRLWDTEVIKEAFDGKQSLRPYYHFPEVHIDRYNIKGKKTMVMLSPRNILTSGLVDNAKNWVTTHIRYTHGYGFVASSVHKTNSIGQPVFYAKDMPQETHLGMEVDNPRIYYSDFRDEFGRYDDPRAYVKTVSPEFDYPSKNNDQDYRWTADRGVPIGGLLSKMAHSILFKDGNLLISSLIKPESKVLYRRNILYRASSIFPMLHLDSDPYLSIVDKKLVWILDAYTHTDRVPYSVLKHYHNTTINYIRNSVKITVDAYSGETNAYAVDEADPILKAYRNIFPGLILPKNKASKELMEHFRYPEDYFDIQARTMSRYHVTDAEMFLNNEDVWEIPTEMGRDGRSIRMTPYYVQMRLPDAEHDEFMIILPFTPLKKNNMSGWMTASCDPENYGSMLLYRFPKNNQTAGPNQMEAMFNQDNTISEINRLLDNDQSSIVRGNLLVIPIGNSLLYVKPLFLKSKVSNIKPIPELRKVILSFQDRVVVGDTYEDALNRLLATSDIYASDVGVRHSKLKDDTMDSDPVETDDTERSAIDIPAMDNFMSKREASKQRTPLTGVREALRLLDDAEKALKNGEFGKYGDLQKQAKQHLQKLSSE